MIYFLMYLFGNLTGIFLMCLLQINRKENS